MTHRWLTRALIALTAPVLLLPGAPSATAATAAPAVPTLDAVAKIYPHLEGGTADATRERKILMPSTTCERGSVIKGAAGKEAFYSPKIESMADLDATGKEPLVGVSAESFPSAKVASQYLRASLAEGKDCPDDAEFGGDVQMKKIRFHLGDERWGFVVNMGTKKKPLFMNALFIRTGDKVVSALSMTTTGKAAPSIPKTVALARLALKTAG